MRSRYFTLLFILLVACCLFLFGTVLGLGFEVIILFPVPVPGPGPGPGEMPPSQMAEEEGVALIEEGTLM